jgi:excisionase family DNA binding protein
MGGILLMIEKQEFEEIMSSAVEKAMESFGARLRAQEENTGTDRYMSAEEVCKYLKLKKSTLYQWTMKGIIPFSKGGDGREKDNGTGRRRLIFDKIEIDKWVLEGKHLTRAERDMEREMRITKADKRKNTSFNLFTDENTQT